MIFKSRLKSVKIYGDLCLIWQTPSLNESRSVLSTSSEGSLFQRTIVAKKTADNTLFGYGFVCTREGACVG